MQLTDVKTFIKRSTFYGSHRYTSIIRKGEWRFKDLKKVYVISILSSETKISLLFDGFFFRYFSLQKSLRSVGYARFL